MIGFTLPIGHNTAFIEWPTRELAVSVDSTVSALHWTIKSLRPVHLRYVNSLSIRKSQRSLQMSAGAQSFFQRSLGSAHETSICQAQPEEHLAACLVIGFAELSGLGIDAARSAEPRRRKMRRRPVKRPHDYCICRQVEGKMERG